jgi:hypothetical protein
MTVCVASLASGSRGNALLIDCGLPQRVIEGTFGTMRVPL